MSSDKDTKAEFYAGSGWLTGQLLIAMPNMSDPRFARTVVYLCAHSANGAMGFVINRLYGELNFRSLLGQVNIPFSETTPDLTVHYGGPVEPGRGFVLHSPEWGHEGTMKIDDKICLTATMEVLQALSDNKGPDKVLLALGYAGWGAGQLDEEIQANGWLVAPADEDILFSSQNDSKWSKALAKIGISPLMLSAEVGHA